jgi:hypothetical protein
MTDLLVQSVRVTLHKLRALYPQSVHHAKQSARHAKGTPFYGSQNPAGGPAQSARLGGRGGFVLLRNPL